MSSYDDMDYVVLILVLVEDTLRDLFRQYRCPIEIVLILVLVEDTLREGME